MAMAKYESVMVISLKNGDEAVQAIIEKFKSLIETSATLHSVDEWGKRKLAYLINKESEGYYVLFNFEAEPDFPAELDRVYKITDGVMRSLIVKKPEGEDFAEPKAKVEEAEETVVEKVEEEVKEVVEEVVEKAEEVVETVKEAVEEVVEDIKEDIEEMKEEIKETTEKAEEPKEAVEETTEE